ncbi:3'-5' exonuclease [Myxococcota bacterium]|nr:3'-5' exonuclease [Myxococcota bacterium]
MGEFVQPPGPLVLRTLEGFRKRGLPVALPELAQSLLSLDAPVSVPLARRIVGSILGLPEDQLRDPIEPARLRPAEEAAVAHVALEHAELCVVDLETTGLSAEDSEILEIGAVRVQALSCVSEFQTLIRPDVPTPRRITEITGIDDTMLGDAPDAVTALRGFQRWLAASPGAPLVAHNARFDTRMLEEGMGRVGLVSAPVPVLCTIKLARRLAPEIGRYNLDHVCAHFGVSNRARHRALGDARATARVLVELLEIALSQSLARTVGDLLDLQSRPPGRRRS